MEKYQAVARSFVRLTRELHALLFELRQAGIEVVHRNRDVPHAGRFRGGTAEIAFAGNNFDHNAILRFNEVIAGVFEHLSELQILYVPIRQPFGVGRGDCKMLNA